MGPESQPNLDVSNGKLGVAFIRYSQHRVTQEDSLGDFTDFLSQSKHRRHVLGVLFMEGGSSLPGDHTHPLW